MATTIVSKGQPGSRSLFADTYLMHKLHSLTGVIPIGAFMIFHLVANSYSLRGETEFNTVVKVIGYFPFVQLIEIGGIFLPILFHAIYGMFIVAEMQGPNGNIAHYGYGRNWLYLLQRWSGVVALGYIAYHVWSTTGHRYNYELHGHAEEGFRVIAYEAMAYRFASIGYLLTYLVGITAAVFHLSNGLFNFGIRWGITVGAQAQKISAMLWAAVGLGLAIIGCATAINFHNLGNWYPVKDATTGAVTSHIVLRDKYPTLDDLVKETSQAPAAPVPGAKPDLPARAGAPAAQETSPAR